MPRSPALGAGPHGPRAGVARTVRHRRLAAALPVAVALSACGAGQQAPATGSPPTGVGVGSSSAVRATSSRPPRLPPGYAALAGSGGPLRIGAPWGGAPCEAIELLPSPRLPAPVLAQVEAVVGEASAAGLPVQVESRPGHPVLDDRGTPAPERSVESVPINGLTKPPPTKTGGAEIRRILNHTVTQGTAGAPRLTRVSLDLYLVAIADDPVIVRKAVRHIIGVGFGLAPSVLTDSGIAGTLDESRDAFSAADLAALRIMSGCVPGG